MLKLMPFELCELTQMHLTHMTKFRLGIPEINAYVTVKQRKN